MSEKRKRQNEIKVRVTAAEQGDIQAAAKRHGLTLASFVRASAMAASRKTVVAAHKSKERALRDFTAELERIGLVTRKRALNKADVHRIVFELQRLQILLFRFHRGGTTR